MRLAVPSLKRYVLLYLHRLLSICLVYLLNCSCIQ